MRAFSRLYEALDASTSTAAKVDALQRYLAQAEAADAAWAVYFLAGGKPRQLVPTALLRRLACEAAGLAPWLFEESYQAVGDLAETIALVLPPARSRRELSLADWMQQRLLPLRGADVGLQAEQITGFWDELDPPGRFLLTKLIGGGFRVGVSKLLVQRALAAQTGLDPAWIAQRMMGYTDARRPPDAQAYARLVSPESLGAADAGQPYPFFLAHALEDAPSPAGPDVRRGESTRPAKPDRRQSPDTASEPASLQARLGPPADWLIEWKYDGIRAQLVRRAGQCWIWSRGEELVTERFPELVEAARALPEGTVLDGEIVVWRDAAPAPFQLLQQRIGRKTLPARVLAAAPVAFIAYDLLEAQGLDQRAQPQGQRRAALELMMAALGQTPQALHLSPRVAGDSWSDLAALRATARERGVEGFMLKHLCARYGLGRRKQEDLAGGTWWKWKLDPYTLDAVLLYAQAGHGRRASVYTDYSFGVWSRPPANAQEAQAVLDAIARREPPQPGALQLVTVAKAYSGLTDAEFLRVDRVIRATTLEKFGPVRSVRPSLVFELGFEGLNRSTRHKSGVALRFPRMLRLRDDKPLHEADSLAQLEALLPGGTPS